MAQGAENRGSLISVPLALRDNPKNPVLDLLWSSKVVMVGLDHLRDSFGKV